jgi:uncharacterized protein (TIGR00369 family)
MHSGTNGNARLHTDEGYEHPLTHKLKTGDFGIMKFLEMQPVSTGDGRAVVELSTGPQHMNPMGTVHGGIFCDLADAAMGMAFGSTLGAGESVTTVELKINFLRPVWETRLRAEARVVSRGKNLGLVECDVKDEQGRLVARSSSTCYVLRGEQARGR